MVKLRGPLFSEAAHGTVGKVLTYSAKRNLRQVRYQRKIGSHTSDEQLTARDKFFAAVTLYFNMPLLVIVAFKTLAEQYRVDVAIGQLNIIGGDLRVVSKAVRNEYLPELLLHKGVPVTNQTIIYKIGDDGTYQTGAEYSRPRFDYTAPNIVYDKATGLEWIADPSELGGIWGTLGNPTSMTWDEAIEACNNLYFQYRGDWRLPNTKELESLIIYSKKNPAIDDSKFKNTKDDKYWGSSITHYGCDNQFFVDFGSGGKGWDQDKNKKKYVRPVRNIPKGHKTRTRQKAK